MFLWYVFPKNKPHFQRQLLNSRVKERLQNGDIILRYGYGYISDGIIRHLNEKYAVSHCGIIQIQNNGIFVIHSDSNSDEKTEGTQITGLDKFTNQSHPNSIIIVRLKKIDSTAQNKIIDTALKYVSEHTPFDYFFNGDDDKELFCTELVWLSYKKALNRNIFSGDNHQTNLLQFKSLYNIRNFDIIYNEQ